MLATLGLITGLALGATGPKPLEATRLYRELGAFDRPRVSIWLDRTAPYDRGDRARVYVSAEQDAYLTVLRIDTDGRVRVLFPQDPWDDNFIPGGRTFEVEDRDGQRAFRVDDPPGSGFVFAIASDDRFDYSPVLTERDHWDYRTIANGQVRGDPYVAVTEIAEQIVGEAGDYDYDLAQYDVERRYDYPRFVCYDCHAYAPYYTWNPYAHNCVRFRVVIYDDPYYYPYRYYGGRRVVVVRPRRPEPRYVFVDNNGGRDYVTRLPNRPRRGSGGEVTPGGGGEMRPRRGEDVGGRGTIPVPGNGGRRIIRNGEVRPDPRTGQPERRRMEPRREEQPSTPESEPRRERPSTDPQDRPMVQPRPPVLREVPRGEPGSQKPDRRRQEPRERPREDRPADRPNVQREPPREEPRAEPQREPERRAQPERRTEPERRAEPRREPERRAEPRRDSGGNRGSSPELRRRPRGQ